jgi:hypothetical protein
VEHRLAFEAYGAAVEVRYADNRLAEELLPLLPPGARPYSRGPVDARFEVAADGVVRLDGDVVARMHGHDRRQDALAELAGLVRAECAIHAPGRVFIHAGVVATGGAAIVIPGDTMSGKTTLVAELVRAGALYYSDEYAVVDPAGMIHPFAQPLSIRPPGSTLGRPSPVAPSRTGSEPVAPGLIVLTRYEQGTTWSPEPCSRGNAALGLLRHTIPAQSRPREALATACRIAQAATAISGPRGEAREIAPALLELAGGGG